MVKCSAYRCDSDSSNKIPGLSFHRFPKDENLKKAWIDNMQLQPNPTGVLCSKHFEEHLIDASVFRTRLRPGSIPTLFNELPPVMHDKENIINLQKTLPIKRTAAGTIVPVLKEVQHKIIPAVSASNITAVIDEENLPGPSNYISKPPSTPPVMPSTELILPTKHEVQGLRRKLIIKNKKIKLLQQQRRRLRRKVSQFSDIVAELKNKLNHDDIHILTNIPGTMHRNQRVPLLKLLKLNKWLSLNASKIPLCIENMPRPKSLPLLGTKLDFIAAGSGTKLHEYVDSRHKQLGPVYCEKLSGNTELVFVSDPMLIKKLFLNLEGKYPVHILPDPWVLYEKLYGSKRGLFFMNGEEWLENRRIMNKFLLKENSETCFETPVKMTVQRLIHKWKTEMENNTLVPDLESEFYRLSIDVIVAVMSGSSSSLKPDKHYEALLTMFSEAVKKIFQTTTKLYGLPIDICQKLNFKVWTDFKESVDISLSLAHKIVNEILLHNKDSNGLINVLVEENVKPDDIKRIMSDFIIAAGDTTSFTSIWTLYLLSKNKSAQQEIYTRNSYINHVIKESMRLYPVAPFLTRILPKESVFGPYRLDKGTPIIASIYTSGRDDQNFSKADEFLPYRWDRNDARRKDLINHVSSASLPFALGARSCIGKKLAILQMTELISQIIHNFDFECVNKDEVKANTSQVLVPSKDIKLSFSLRKSEIKQ